MTRCRACKAPITWATTEAGRLIPLDAEPAPNGNIVLVDDVALVLTPAVLARLADERERYQPHFATCPYANEFRRAQ
jgi:hypothetical protein